MRRVLAILLGLAVTAALLGYALAMQQPRVARYTVKLPNWPAGQKPFRIVQISDLHGNWIDMPPQRISGIVAQANALQPDMIVLTGDYLGGKVVDWPHMPLGDFADRLAKLHAPYGVFAILGNHDTATWAGWALDQHGIRQLYNSAVDVGPLSIAGVGDAGSVPSTLSALHATLHRGTPSKPLILLAHQPDYFRLDEGHYDLLIVGHTHGGQLKLPLLGARSYGPFRDAHLRGLFNENGRVMVVSSGLGTSTFPMRIGVRPEIVEVTLTGTGATAAAR